MRELLRAPVNRLGVTALRRMPTAVIVIVLCRCYAVECEPKLLEHNDFQRYHLRWNNSPHISSSKCSIVPGLDHISRRGRELSSPITKDGDDLHCRFDCVFGEIMILVDIRESTRNFADAKELNYLGVKTPMNLSSAVSFSYCFGCCRAL